MNNHENTLVILSPGFPESEEDSTCLPLQQQLVRSIKKLYPDLIIIILSFQYPYHKKKYEWFGVTVISFNGRNRGGWHRLLLRQRLYATLKKINNTKKIIGLLNFWYGECALIGKKFAERHGLKHICWIWGQDAKKGNKYVPRIPPKANELAVLSDFLQNEFEKNYGIRPQYVIPPGINSKEFNEEIKPKDIDIVAAGSLIPLKQYGIFVNVIAEIKKQIPGIKAILIGDGPEKNKLLALIETNGLQSNIILAGERPHTEVLQMMQRAKIFLHPSSYEGFGIVCIEALYSGAQVISFVKPMNTEIENWHIVTNVEEMIQKTMEILEHPAIGFKRIIPYTIEETVQKLSKLFSF